MEEVPFFSVDPIAVDGIEERARLSEAGAVVSFQGVVRADRTQEGNVTALEFESYEALGEKEVGRILGEVKEKWPGTRLLLQHRLGRVPVGETSLFLVVSSPEIPDAFSACHYVLDQMKSRVPLWKKDVFSDGVSRWSDHHRETMLISDSVLTYPPS
ncbi:MAG: molybdenum cofactor biosynthesis protein MoaE [Elusimicrobia bacterium]|jgi:molybdopterin synthase catalytic subunit|nr:molybdenum cofactor biosynthesis protein MoaE [Elusimicrobiota bacterium]